VFLLLSELLSMSVELGEECGVPLVDIAVSLSMSVELGEECGVPLVCSRDGGCGRD
jgi:hypothetical protein